MMAYHELYSLVALFALANVYLGALVEVSGMLGSKDEKLSHPGTLGELKAMMATLRRFTRKHPAYVAALIGSSIAYSRAFCLPSCQLLRYATGALFPARTAVPVASIALTAGSMGTYFMSLLCLKPLLMDQFQERAEYVRAKVHRDPFAASVILAGLTMVPVFPTHFINVIAPMMDIPAWHFLPAAFVGSLPEAYFLIRSAKDLPHVEHTRDLLSVTNVVVSSAIGLALVIPGFWMASSSASSHSDGPDGARSRRHHKNKAPASTHHRPAATTSEEGVDTDDHDSNDHHQHLLMPTPRISSSDKRRLLLHPSTSMALLRPTFSTFPEITSPSSSTSTTAAFASVSAPAAGGGSSIVEGTEDFLVQYSRQLLIHHQQHGLSADEGSAHASLTDVIRRRATSDPLIAIGPRRRRRQTRNRVSIIRRMSIN